MLVYQRVSPNFPVMLQGSPGLHKTAARGQWPDDAQKEAKVRDLQSLAGWIQSEAMCDSQWKKRSIRSDRIGNLPSIYIYIYIFIDIYVLYIYIYNTFNHQYHVWVIWGVWKWSISHPKWQSLLKMRRNHAISGWCFQPIWTVDDNQSCTRPQSVVLWPLHYHP